ncbi:hypothetical protein HDU76_013668, partial [Blyttiomyces sp. JEL0837]
MNGHGSLEPNIDVDVTDTLRLVDVVRHENQQLNEKLRELQEELETVSTECNQYKN